LLKQTLLSTFTNTKV